MKWELIILATLAVVFGSFCIHEGHDSTIIASVFTFLGVIGGYIYGKKTEETEETTETKT